MSKNVLETQEKHYKVRKDIVLDNELAKNNVLMYSLHPIWFFLFGIS
jgi:hypothetical protein